MFVIALLYLLFHVVQRLDVIAKELQNAVIKKGSGDNITVCIVQFDWSPVSTLRKWWNWLWGKVRFFNF
jgi:hypothetical protein